MNYIEILIRFENIQSSINVKLKEGVCLPKAIMIVPLEDEHLKSVYVESSRESKAFLFIYSPRQMNDFTPEYIVQFHQQPFKEESPCVDTKF